jgi:hypothetical protein
MKGVHIPVLEPMDTELNYTVVMWRVDAVQSASGADFAALVLQSDEQEYFCWSGHSIA